jgi:hypothetical protein
VILGASGGSAKPGPFTDDARKSFAEAIAEAEARNPATSTMILWRAGNTQPTSITLETMGAYSDTDPFDCPKMTRILEKSLPHMDRVDLKMDNFGMNILNLPACYDERFPGDAERMKRAGSVALLLKHHFINGVRASVDLFKTGGRWTKVLMIREWAKYGPTWARSVPADPGISHCHGRTEGVVWSTLDEAFRHLNPPRESPGGKKGFL